MKKFIPIIVVALLIVGGGAFYLINNSQKSEDTTQTSSSENASSNVFNPVNTLSEPFVVSFKTEGEQGGTSANIEYDGKENWRYTSQSADNSTEMIITPSANYMKNGETWFKLPTDSSTAQVFQKDAYQVTDSELKDFQAAVTYRGEEACPAGSCYVWVAKNYKGNDSLEFYIDKKTNRINQLITSTKTGKITIIYDYKPVTITIPTVVSEIPGQ